MDFMQFAIGNVLGIAGFVLVVMALLKVFQIATTLNEIKELLGRIHRSTLDHAPDYAAGRVPAPALPPLYSQSGEEMLRAAVAAEQPAPQPEIVQPR